MKRAVVIGGLAAVALGSFSIPAAAEVSPLGANVARPYQVISKTEAILGGAPSSLAAILAMQNATPLRPVSAALPINPASSGAPAVTDFDISPREVPVDRPDVFGSVALAISSTPLDDRWQKVADGNAGAVAVTYAASVQSQAPLARLDAVNRFVNERVRFNSDNAMFGADDRWMTGAETLRRGQGDCEDYAITKLQMLRRAGFAEKDLYLVILRDTRRAADHAVLVVRAEGRLLVLDNGTDRIVDSDTMADYRPIMTYSGNRAWTHGYRRSAPTYSYASAAPVNGPIELAPSAQNEPAALVGIDSITLAAATLPVASMVMSF